MNMPGPLPPKGSVTPLNSSLPPEPDGILVLGIGNLLMGDEGLGVHFARRMASEKLPPDVEVLDGGTAGFQLMEWLERHRHVIMVDATLDGAPAGSIREIEPRFSADFPRAMSTHDIGLKDLIEGLYLLGKAPHIILFAVSIESVQPLYVGLSPDVEAVLPTLAERVKNKIHSLSRQMSDVKRSSPHV